jgi:hypothetical protein
VTIWAGCRGIIEWLERADGQARRSRGPWADRSSDVPKPVEAPFPAM